MRLKNVRSEPFLTRVTLVWRIGTKKKKKSFAPFNSMLKLATDHLLFGELNSRLARTLVTSSWKQLLLKKKNSLVSATGDLWIVGFYYEYLLSCFTKSPLINKSSTSTPCLFLHCVKVGDFFFKSLWNLLRMFPSQFVKGDNVCVNAVKMIGLITFILAMGQCGISFN